MPPPSCVSLFNAVCNTFNLPPLPSFLCVHPSLVQLSRREGGREGLSSCSWRHACLHCLRDTRVHAYVALSMTMHLFFRSTFFLFFSFYFHFLPSLFFMQISRAFVFLFLVPSPTLENKMRGGWRGFQPLEPRESEGAGGEGVNRFV